MSLQTVEIDLQKIKENIFNLKTLLKPGVRFMAVVKSNAYGHGIVQVAKTAVESGVNWLGVVNLEEAIKLRENNIEIPILILGYPDFSLIQSAAQKLITIPVFSIEFAEKLANFKLNYPLTVHLKVETGINRLGLEKNEVVKAYNILAKNPKIIVEGIYSHFASVEEQDMEYSNKQIKRFDEILKELVKKKIHIPLKHISATSALMILPDAQYNMVRSGIGIYGLWPSKEVKEQFLKRTQKQENFLQPALTYKTQIVQVKNVKKGDKIGYGCTYTAEKNMKIAVLPIGYFENMDRGLSNNGEVLIAGQRCPIVGRICMNMAVIDISQLNFKFSIRQAQDRKISNVKNNEVIVIGKQGKEEITTDEVAKRLGTINYEVVARIPEHITRIYRI